MQPSHVLLELPIGARFGQGHMAHVVIQIHRFIFHPHRVGQIKRHQREFTGEQFSQMHALGNARFGMLIKIISLHARRHIEHAERAHMHGHFRAFKMQEHRILRA